MTERSSDPLTQSSSGRVDIARRQTVEQLSADGARFSVPLNLAYHILQRLESAQESVGSGSIFLYLRDLNVVASQATIGRVLHLLDHQRLTVKVSNRGRILTPVGKRVLEELRRREGRRHWAEQILKDAEPATRHEFLTVLSALRLLDANLARLAAKNATPEQIAAMYRILEEQRQNLGAPGQGADQGTTFHALIGEACGNRFLHAAVSLIWNSNKPIRDLWYEANLLTGVSSYPDHLRILKAISAKNPQKAQNAMEAHFDRFIRAVEKHVLDGEARSQNDGSSGDGAGRAR